MSETTTQSRGISGEDLDLLSRLLEEEGFGTEGRSAIPRRGVDAESPADIPLSFAQARLWFLDRLQPGSAQYNLYSARRFPQPIVLSVLARTLAELTRRHETLRTTFAETEGRAVQVIAPAPTGVAIPQIIDLRALPATRRQDEVARAASAESRRPFDLARGPLWRTAVIHADESEDILLSVMHHIISDGWSMGVMTAEVSRLYAAFAAGRPSPLPELPIQYADFALWQRGRLDGGEFVRELDYWRAELAGAPQILDLPADRPRPAIQSFRGASEMFSIPAADAARLRELAREEGATLFMALLASLGAALGRIAGRDDLLIGSPIANRNRPEIEALIGFFVNTLVLRIDLGGRPSLRELVRRVKRRTLGAYDHQNLPFEKLVEELRPERDLAHAPLVQVMLALQTEDTPAGAGAGGVTGPGQVPLRNGTAKLDLLISMIESARGMNGVAEYATDLFEAATVLRFLDTWRTLIAGAFATPEAADRPIAELPLLDPAETRRLVVDWNDTAVVYDQAGARLHDLVFAQAAATPDAIAVVFEERALSYGELARAARRLARSLRARGIGPEVAVGVCLERSLEMSISLLAVLEAGGFYVPLDPDYPADRLAYMLDDSRVPVLLISAAVRARIGGLPEGVALVDPGDPGDLPALVERAKTEPETLAYAIYTSGSTGKPKAGMNAHRGIVNRLLWMRGRYAFGPADRVLQKTPFSFDVSLWELFLPLLSGARLVMARPGGHQDAAYLVDLVAREGVSVLHFVPSMLQVFVGEPGVAELTSMRALICSGEALPPALVDRFFALFSGRPAESHPELHNLYGPTEAAVDVTEQACRPGLATVPIGRPIANLRIYLLDPAGLPVPVGVPGELFIGGVGVGRGYLHRPLLTAAAFVPDGTSGEPGARLYRTGDLCRFASDGAIEYLGRIDTQVKIRGFRIELGEIERALAEHPDVSECVVATYGPATDRRIAAYLVPGSAKPPVIEELRAFLGRSLPLYMVPQAFVALPALPLSPNGKIDRKALPSPEASRAILGEEYVAPRTVSEQVLAAIWEQVLGVEQVGARDNFFSLGGDSIRSIQVLALARKRGLEISLQQLFRHQTIAGLAAVAGRASAERLAELEAPSEPFSLLAPEDRQRLPSGLGIALTDAYPLAMLQAGMLFHMVLRPEDPPYHNVDSWQLVARFDEDAFARATADVVARHPVMRTSFHLTGFSEPIQIVHAQATLPLTVIDVGHLPADEQQREVEKLVREQKRTLFDFTKAPQLRFFVHRLDDEHFQLTLTENHAVFDGWSLHSTLAEIFGRYFAYLRGENPAPEPPLGLLFRDFIAAERRTLESEEAKAFWREQLAGASVLALPRRFPVTEAPVGPRVHRLTPNLPPDVSTAVRALSRRLGLPVKSVLLGAHFKVMSLLSGSPDVMIGLGFNGRAEVLGGEDVRGLYLNTLPIRFGVRDESFARASERAFETELAVLPFRRYPYNRLQQEHGGQPFYDVIFNYIHFHVANEMLAREGVAVAGFHSAEGTSFLLQAAFAPGSDERGIHFALEYDSARLSDADAGWIAGYFTRYFAALAADPDASTATVALLSPEEREQIRAATGLPVRAAAAAAPTLVDLFARSVAAYGSREAVRCGDAGLTYAELNARADALAGRLIRDGVLPGDLVAVSLHRSLDLIVALLAVLKTGAGYVPIDPTYPEDRRTLLREDSGARLLLAEIPGDLSAAAPPRVSIDAITAGDVAYVIYTSGSTGKPKGVPVRHGEVARLLSSTESWFGFGPDDVWTLFHSYAFDFSVWEIWGALAYGGRLVVVPTEVSRAPESFYRLVRDERVTVLNQTPSAFQQLSWAERAVVETDGPAPLALRYVIFGGEALDLAGLAPWFERHPDSKLINMYGITETCVHVTYREIRKADVEAKRGSLIGVPIPDLAVQVLDAFGVPSPLGVSGEMYVSGAGLAVGYLGRPELTAERFVPDPFSGMPGARAYRSGDLARRLPAGSGFDLEYLGRIDNQVKIRGFRIELAEIEAVLAAQPGVRRAVVVPREDVAGDKRLVAYVVLQDGALAADDLRAAARAQLPEYMVPAMVVILPELPLTPHGKVDVRALPLPAGIREGSRQAYVEPRTPLEERIAAIWAEALRIERVGVHDSFFDLGGNSILATQVFARLRETFGFEVPMRTLFEEPTIERLAVTIGDLQARGPSLEAEMQKIAPRRSEGAAAGEAPVAAPRDVKKMRTDLEAMTPEAIRKLLAEKRARKQGGKG